MKFKEFVVNSLPRVRSRKKKSTPQKTLKNELYDRNRNRCGPRITWEKAFGVSSSDEGEHDLNEEVGCDYSLEEAVKTACGQIIDTFRYQDTSSFSDQNLSHQFSLDFIQQNSSFSDDHKDFNTVPKTRSRIRTNPWIPSPKSSTTSSASCSACSSTSTSPALSPSNKCNSYNNNNNNSKASLVLPGLNSLLPCYDEISQCSCQFYSDVTANQQNNLNCGVTPSCDTDESSDLSPSVDMSKFHVHHNISFEYEETLECSLEESQVKRDVSIEDLLTDDDVLRDAAVQTDFTDETEECCWPCQGDMGTELTEYSRCSDCMQDSTDTGYSSLGRDGRIEVDDDFQFYAVNQKCDGSYRLNVSSNGSAVLCSTVPEEKIISCCHYDGTVSTVNDDDVILFTDDVISPKTSVISSIPDVILYTNDVISRSIDVIPPTDVMSPTNDVISQYVDVIPPTDVISPTNDVISQSVDVIPPNDATPPINDVRPPNDVMDEVMYREESGRTLLQVKSSLQEKVGRLRLEKRIVEEKIREAQEEEKLVEQQRCRFQQLLSFHKKEILLNTLHHLTERLEDQGNRLQTSYSIILSMQQRFAKRQDATSLVSRAAS